MENDFAHWLTRLGIPQLFFWLYVLFVVVGLLATAAYDNYLADHQKQVELPETFGSQGRLQRTLLKVLFMRREPMMSRWLVGLTWLLRLNLILILICGLAMCAHPAPT